MQFTIRMLSVTRFAPSPTGLLHLGHAYAAWFAREHGDQMILRLEDIDTGRVRQEYCTAILEDLEWLEVRWDGEVVRQSQRLKLYQHALDQLGSLGVTYPCFCTRKQIQAEIERAVEAPHGPDGPVYPGTCRLLAPSEAARRIDSGEPFVTRLDCAKAVRTTGPLRFVEANESRTVDPAAFGDFVVARKDVPTSYHLSMVVDDNAQGVTLVTRGEDLLPASMPQRLLQSLLGFSEPKYLHHGLVVDPAGRRLAKRDNAQSLRSLRESGLTPSQVRRLAESQLAPPKV